MNNYINWELASHKDVLNAIDDIKIRNIVEDLKGAVNNGGHIVLAFEDVTSAESQGFMEGFNIKRIPNHPEIIVEKIDNSSKPNNFNDSDVMLYISNEESEKSVRFMEFVRNSNIKIHIISGCVDSNDSETIREGYKILSDLISELVERELFGRKAVLVDRDDTLAIDVPYCSRPEDLNLYDGVPEAVAKLNNAGFLVIMITNQSVVGRGRIDVNMLETIHNKMRNDLKAGGGHIDDLFFCPHHPDDCCNCRKPEIGMGIAAIKKYNLKPSVSYMVGDHEKDIEFGRRLGLNTIQVSPDYPFTKAINKILPN